MLNISSASLSGASLSDDEFTVLSIAAEGQSMMAIGRWAAPVRALTSQGYLRKLDEANFVITDAGRQAQQEHDARVDSNYIEAAVKVNNARVAAKSFAEVAAQNYANAVRVAMQATGDSQHVAVANWGDAILKRVMEILREAERS